LCELCASYTMCETCEQSEYSEDTWGEFGVKHVWYNISVQKSIKTHRGTLVDMIQRPNWGIACYMDNAIQSCEADEHIYHESLVHPAMCAAAMNDSIKRVMIIGGGEGATAREVLKWQSVEAVDMFEWDKDIVDLFKTEYSQWAKGAWNDKRLTIYHDDIFEVIKTSPTATYDIIIIDLFDPSEANTVEWYILLNSIQRWLSSNGAIVMYAGIRNFLTKMQPYHIIQHIISNHFEKVDDKVINPLLHNREIVPYKVYIPSFSGESVFLLIKNTASSITFNGQISTHLTDDIWNSYKIFNW